MKPYFILFGIPFIYCCFREYFGFTSNNSIIPLVAYIYIILGFYYHQGRKDEAQ